MDDVTLDASVQEKLTPLLEHYNEATGEEQQQTLSRILDLSQDLKALNYLLSGSSYLFVIDLACLASRREFLKLDKWLSDKIASLGKPFLEACRLFLKKRCHVLLPDTDPAKFRASLPTDTLNSFFACIKQYLANNADTAAAAAGGGVSPTNELDRELISMTSKYADYDALPRAHISPVASEGLEMKLSGNIVYNPNNPEDFYYQTDVTFEKEVEDEADSIFQKIYNSDQPESMSIAAFFELLTKLHDSGIPRDNSLFLCMLRNLLKEYRYLCNYPTRELVITGELFGGLIEYGLISNLILIIVLKYILDSAKKPADSHSYILAIAAINRFRERLGEFPGLCNQLSAIPHYPQFPAHLREFIENGRNLHEPPSVSLTPASKAVALGPPTPKRVQAIGANLIGSGNGAANLPSSFPGVKSSLSSSTTSSPLNVPEIASVPPNIFQDKIAFIINNLSMLNLAKKVEEFKEVLAKENCMYNVWISQYIVVKRVSLEANFHELYANFVVKLSLADLAKLILQETYRNIKILLRSNKETENHNDRSLLKNLGQWLGLITIGQDKPVLSIDLDLRDLLLEAFHEGQHRLHYVVPFIAKVIAGCAKSRVFRPPNPWTDLFISMLVELHSEPDLKLNLKFEVEVLCKNLDLDMSSYVGRCSLLHNKELLSKIDPAPSSPTLQQLQQQQFTQQVQPAPSLMPNPTPEPGLIWMPDQSLDTPLDVGLMHHQTQHSSGFILQKVANLHNYNDINISSISNLSVALFIKPNLRLIMLQPALKGFIKTVIEKNVQEWISYISDRVTKVPMVTTETLVKMDFSKEPNPELMRLAAQSMLKSLIAGFSLINTKESLSNRIHTSILSVLQTTVKNVTEEIINTTASSIVNDNIDLCVCFVQKTCIERGLEELDKKLKAEIDSGAFGNPETLKAKAGTITMKQMVVYDEMGRNIPGFFSTASTPNAMMANEAQLKTSSNVLSGPLHSNLSNDLVQQLQAQQQQQQQQAPTAPVIYDKLISQLCELIQEFEYVNYNTEGMHAVLDILRQSKSNPRDQGTALQLIKSVISAFRELIINAEAATSDFAIMARIRDFYLILLKALTDQRAFNVRFTTTNITRFVMEQWITLNPSFPDELFDILSRSYLISFAYMDNQFYQLLENGQNKMAINIILNFLKCYLASGVTANFFTNTLELLKEITLKVNQSSHPLLTDLKNIVGMARVNPPAAAAAAASIVTNNVASPAVTPAAAPEMDVPVMHDKVELIIKDWMDNFNSPKNSISNSFSFMVKNMNAQGLLKNDDMISRFFKFFLEMVVDRCYTVFNFGAQHKSVSLNEIHTKCYEYIGAFSVLVLLFIKQSGNHGNIDQKFQFLNRILNLIVVTAMKDQELRLQEFQPLPYYRILISIFVEFFYSPLNLGFQDFLYADEFFDAFKTHIVQCYCTNLRRLSPLKVPSFTYAWLDLISHRVFIGKCLDNSPQVNTKSWNNYFILLSELLTFQKPILQNQELNLTSKYLYKGTLKLFLLLLHDFPEFLCEYCYMICDIIPHTAFQIRNLVLSAFPATMRLPDPFSPNLKVESLNEILHPYKGLINSSFIEKLPFKNELDLYIKQRSAHYLADIGQYFTLHSGNQADQLLYINLLIFYLGQHATKAFNFITFDNITRDSSVEIIQYLLANMDNERRYVLLSSMVNHLRYPNLETQYFICVLLHLFKQSEAFIKEQIVRVLLERLFVFRPHPWGLLFIVNELSKNETYEFWDYEFIKFEPKIKRILANLGIYNSNELRNAAGVGDF